MYPIRCSTGKDHTFDDQFKCSACGISYEEYDIANCKFIDLRDTLQKIAVSNNGNRPEFFAEAMFLAMHMTHRTIQQNFFRGLTLFIDKMKDMPTDARNSDCVEWCKKAAKIDRGFSHI